MQGHSLFLGTQDPALGPLVTAEPFAVLGGGGDSISSCPPPPQTEPGAVLGPIFFGGGGEGKLRVFLCVCGGHS